MKQKTLAIPIRLTDYSNSSQIVSLLTPDVGALDGLAKGAFRLKGSFLSPFDLAVLYEVVYVERRSSGLSILTEASVAGRLPGSCATAGSVTSERLTFLSFSARS